MIFIYKTETDSQTQETNLWLPKGKSGGGTNKEYEQIHTTIYKIDKKQGFIAQGTPLRCTVETNTTL